MSNPFEDLRQAVVVRPMNSPGPQGAAGPELKIQYSYDGQSWHNDPVETDRYLSFSTDNGVSWSEAIYFNNLAETLEWVEKARQWAENPENVPVIEPDQFSALHHASRAARSEENAEAAALDAELAAIGAFGVPPAPWNSTTVYNYNDIVNFGNGHIYRCIGTNIVGVDHAPNIDGIDNEEDWVRITVVLDGYFEVDENGDFMPMIAPTNSEIFMLDENSDITYQDPIDIEVTRTTIELFTLDENGDIAYRDPTDHRPGGGNIELYKEIEFVDSIADFRNTHFYGTTKYVYVAGYYGAGTPGGGMFYKDPKNYEPDNSGTIIVDKDGVRWQRANVHEEYYASWFGVSPDIEDNSPLIQNALNIIPSGSILIFGPGTYKCQQTITIPNHPTVQNQLKYLTLQGSAKLPKGIKINATTLLYTGHDPLTLTPFIDFRGDTRNKRFIGSIRNMSFWGDNKNIVGLWFYDCVGSLFDDVYVERCKCGIQIDSYYYYCKFNRVQCVYCDYGLKAEGSANGASFYCCQFVRNITAGFAGNLNNTGNASTHFYGCYFEGNGTAIEANLTSCIEINNCYFEKNTKYILNILCPNIDYCTPLVVLNNSIIALLGSELSLNKSVIKQVANCDNIVSYDISNNIIANQWTEDYDYFIYVESGNLAIKAENNRLKKPSAPFPFCSIEPLESSYFNNDFSQ